MELTEENFQEYALRHYTIKTVSRDEFWSDLQLIYLLTDSIKRFSPERPTRLLLNQFISLLNIFEAEGLANMLRYKLDTKYHNRLKSILLCFGIWRQDIIPDNITEDHELSMAINNNFDNWRFQNA